MAFIDDITIHAMAGRGGDGVVRWLHIKGHDKAGPAGGDGGRGGDVIIEGVRDLAALSNYQYEKKFRADDGDPGDGNNKKGKDGEDLILRVPVGTIVTNTTTKEAFEILHHGEQKVIFKGGNGGLGNPHFKGAVNQNPIQSTPGKNGGAGDIRFSLKIIADVGLVGFPNAGKSSLLNSLTRARSKVGGYPFTTLEPHLGDLYGYLVADIPGLIEGASTGRGLGSKFLRHIERTVLIAHLVSAEQEDIVGTYRAIRTELETFSPELMGKREIVVLSKTDLLTEEELAEKMAELKKASGAEVYPLSIIDDEILKNFTDSLVREIRDVRGD
ncbi:MAG: GTPase Obg [Parcubacteria group bacterium]|nr:GTPase Obg [Parcubacteria group bacterium]